VHVLPRRQALLSCLSGPGVPCAGGPGPWPL